MEKTYRALIGVPEYRTEDPSKKITKAEREKYQAHIIETALHYWDSTIPVQPYPDFFFDPDAYYETLLRNSLAIDQISNAGKSIDNPCEALNFFGNRMGKFFYTEVPAEYKNEDKRKPSKRTKVVTYSNENPEGMFSTYNFPITIPYNGISVETSKLINKNYGTSHDMITVGELDCEATYMPKVGFIMYTEPQEEASRQVPETCYDILETDDPQEMLDWYLEKLGRGGMVGLIECTI